MANKTLKMQIVRTILQLLRRKTSEREIAQAVGISRTTVTEYKKKLSVKPLEELLKMSDAELAELLYPQAAVAPQADIRRSDFDERCDYYLKELGRNGVTKQLLWEEYRREFPDGYGRSQFNDLLARHKKKTDVTMHFTHRPGELLMIDFAGDRLHVYDHATEKKVACQVLICVLPYSGYSFVKAIPNATLPWLVKALNDCLVYFDGVPQSLKCDNMRQAVTRTCKYEPQFTDMITNWANHNNIYLQAARVRKPRDKAHVENEVKLSYSRIYAPLRDEKFYTIEELNEAIVEQLKKHHKKQLSKKDFSRKQLFEQREKEELQPLPSELFVMKYETKSKVQRNYHVLLGQDRHFYSVPFHLVGKTMRLVYDTDLVEIYHQHQRVAVHRRSFKRYDYTTLVEHRPESHKKYHEQMGWDSDYFMKEAKKFGSSTASYVKRMLESKQYPEQMYNSCIGLLRLSKSYPPERIEAACARALQGSSTTYTTIKTILSNNADQLGDPEADEQKEFRLPDHENLRGSKAYS
jgi:transposase